MRNIKESGSPLKEERICRQDRYIALTLVAEILNYFVRSALRSVLLDGPRWIKQLTWRQN